MRRVLLLLPVLLAVAILSGFLLSSRLTRAQNTNVTISFDMDTSTNTYDENTNTMSVGSVEFCLESATANTVTHTHPAQLIIQNVEDLIGWQARLNYTGDKMRPNTVNFIPFTDNTTGQNVSFNNLPLDAGVHHDLVTASSIPAGAPGAQTASFGATYLGSQTFPVSPDTPAKSPPDDTSYSAPTGGVLATVILQVVGDQTGQNLFVDMDDAAPNPPGSGISFFNGNSTTEILLPDNNLGDAYHAEGAVCGAATPTVATPTPTDTGTPGAATPTATGGGTGGASGSAGAGSRTPTGGAGASRTQAQQPSTLPPTGGDDGGASALTYALLVATLAVPAAGAAYGIRRLRRR
jgi:hypothetical protein